MIEECHMKLKCFSNKTIYQQNIHVLFQNILYFFLSNIFHPFQLFKEIMTYFSQYWLFSYLKVLLTSAIYIFSPIFIYTHVCFIYQGVWICVCLYKICSIQKCVWWEISFFISSHISPLAQDLILCNSIKLPSITEESSTAWKEESYYYRHTLIT